MSDDSFAGFIPHVPPQFDAMVLSAFLSSKLVVSDGQRATEDPWGS